MHPFLRWAGSKRQLVPLFTRICSTLTYDTYIEPFAGSASLFFALGSPRAVLGDINADLISTYRAVRQSPRAVANLLAQMPITRAFYLHLRAMPVGTLSATLRAARFIYLNRYCFNGLYRTNSTGLFNVPYASGRTGQLPNVDVLCTAAEMLINTTLSSRAFHITVERYLTARSLVYLDPPYLVGARRTFRQYGDRVFDSSDLTRLNDLLYTIDAFGAKFIVTYADSAEGRALADGWHSIDHITLRKIASSAEQRGRVSELLISNLPLSGFITRTQQG